ncbi:MAG TPA: hypothetical protein VI322_01650 [Candidatus Saccharimonadia bacterium]
MTNSTRAKSFRELGIIAFAVFVVIGAVFGVSRSWLFVGLIFLSGLGLLAVLLIVTSSQTPVDCHATMAI